MDCAPATVAGGAAATTPSRGDPGVGRRSRECLAAGRAAIHDRAWALALAPASAPVREGEAEADRAAVAVRTSEYSSSMDKTCRIGVRGDQPMPYGMVASSGIHWSW